MAEYNKRKREVKYFFFKMIYKNYVIRELGKNSFSVYVIKTGEYMGYYTSVYTQDILDLLAILNKKDYTLNLIMKYIDSRINEIENVNYYGDDDTVELVKLLDQARLDELKSLKKRIDNDFFF